MSFQNTNLSLAHDNNANRIKNAVNRVLLEEANAISEFALNSDCCVDAVELILQSTGPLIVAGIGKSGHIGNKIASSFRSLGKPAIFLHAAEASHGDLGLVQSGSVVLVLSNSGETSELSDLLNYCMGHDIPIVGLTGGVDSALAKASKVAIVYGKLQEACHNGLAPTTSTTVSLAIGDALAVAVSESLGTAPEDFRKYHPGGKLGNRLATVKDLMRTGDAMPTLNYDSDISEVVVTISEKALGIAVLLEGDSVFGAITDGDLRRNMDRLWSLSPKEISTREPITIDESCLISDAATLMGERGISACLVMKNNALVGVLHIHDCMRAGF